MQHAGLDEKVGRLDDAIGMKGDWIDGTRM